MRTEEKKREEAKQEKQQWVSRGKQEDSGEGQQRENEG